MLQITTSDATITVGLLDPNQNLVAMGVQLKVRAAKLSILHTHSVLSQQGKLSRLPVNGTAAFGDATTPISLYGPSAVRDSSLAALKEHRYL